MSIELSVTGLNKFDKISKIANLKPVFCHQADSIDFVASEIIKTRHRRIPIVYQNKKLVGIVTTMDILDAFLRGQPFDEEISSIMIRDVISCSLDDSIGYVLQKFKLSRRGGFPVVDKNKKLVGIVSERDFVRCFSSVRFGIKIKDLMTKKPFILLSKMSIKDSIKSLVNSHYRRLPVVDNGKLVGIVVAIDLLKYIKKHNYKIEKLSDSITSILIKDVFTIDKDKDVSDAIELMKAKDVGGILVVDNQKNLEGIITERDILTEIV